MEELKKSLSEADDDYLIGISNKGILKRSYKELETANITASFIDGSAFITVDGTKCVIPATIAESSCTCPSRSICRHIVTAVLWLKRELLSSNPEEKKEPEIKENKIEKELKEYPVEKLQKAMKKRYYNSFIEKARVGVLPLMEELSTITVDIIEDNMTVKLLSPLEYSACTCHSKELCKHKAAAILAWKLKHKIINIESLIPVEESASADIERLNTCADICGSFIERLFSDGLVRTPDDAAEYAESDALICHNAGFPDGEKLMREIGNRLEAYLSHSPEFSTESLFSTIMEAYLLMNKIKAEKEPSKIGELAGKFKGEYTITDELEIIPIAQRSFSSAAGYDGEIYYFINKSKCSEDIPFLTFSDIRPSYYENNRRSRMSNAPWGLYGSCSSLMDYEMRLTLPKLSGIKLSSSSDTKAVQICKPNLNQKSVYDRIYTDFRKLIEDNFVNKENASSEILVMLMPKKCISSQFSEITQTHTIISEDFYGQRLSIKARYNSKTRVFFDQLAAVGETMLENPEKSFVIFGNAYIENGYCNIYPIAVFDKIQAAEPENEERLSCNSGINSHFLNKFREMTTVLCDIIQCGINSFDLYGQIADYAEESEASGLIVLSEKLRKLSAELSSRNHTFSNDNTEIIKLFSELYSYFKTGIRKTETGCAIENLYNTE